ncbi:SGNH/GDSL hydrolase family protein [Plantactinospora sp. B5E13]|uniref:SGNH/GDSL hydrolase family protein n=1 Tax=Plantactinospora sp. B5E13 TaxID=3153758 RepID=UPI00325ED6BB
MDDPTWTGPGSTAAAARRPAGRWVTSWAAMPQLTEPANLPPPPFAGENLVMVDSTLRQTVRVSVGGERLRLRLSNTFGRAPLVIAATAVALPAGGRAGASGTEPGTTRPVTFGGRRCATVPAGAQLVSDPVDLPIPARSNLTVTLHLAQGHPATEVTSHPGSRTTSHLLGGHHVEETDLPGATPVEHWYFLGGLEVSGSPATAVVMLGDSLTDGRGSTTNGNDRWPDQLLDRLQAYHGTADVAVVNQGAGGNRILNDGLGPNALARLDRDVLAQTGVRWLVVFEGINDIGTAAATEAAQKAVTDDLICAYDQIVTRAHAQGIRVYGGTLAPFGGHGDYDDPTGLREASRQAVNGWIRTSGRFDEVLDFDVAVRDPGHPGRLRAAVDTGDHLHLNPTGYRLLAEAVPVELFRG